MRKLIILKSLVDFIWVIAIIGYSLAILLLLVILFDDTVFNNYKINDIKISSMSFPKKVIFLILFIVNLLLFYCLNLFRKILSSFINLDVFNVKVIEYFNRIGNVLISLQTFNIIFLSISKLLFNETLNLTLDIFDSKLLLICLGLFFIILSEIFKLAKQAKQENDLTI